MGKVIILMLMYYIDMDYIAGMSSAQGLSQKYSDDLATRASEIQSAKSNYAELGSQYQQQLSTYKNMMDKPFETLGDVAGEYVATKAIGMARNKYLAYTVITSHKVNQ